MNLRGRPAAVWAFPLAVLALGLVLLATDLGHGASRLRNVLFDAFERTAPRIYSEADSQSPYRVRVLEADSASLQRFGPWPWPRAVLARLTRELRGAGAASVVFTFPLDVPDATSPRSLLAEIPAGPEYSGQSPSGHGVRAGRDVESRPLDAWVDDTLRHTLDDL